MPNKTNMTTNQFEEVDAIEKAYPEAYKLARQFHELYEEYAPQFGYETRKDTKEFDPKSNNGRLMAKVCYEVVHTSITKALVKQEIRLRKEYETYQINTK